MSVVCLSDRVAAVLFDSHPRGKGFIVRLNMETPMSMI